VGRWRGASNGALMGRFPSLRKLVFKAGEIGMEGRGGFEWGVERGVEKAFCKRGLHRISLCLACQTFFYVPYSSCVQLLYYQT
jgi:hypothetical protein